MGNTEQSLLRNLASNEIGDSYFTFSSPDIQNQSAVYAQRIDDGEVISKFYSGLQDDRLLFTATGELDIYSSAALQALVSYQFGRYPEITKTILDFSEVESIDSFVLGVMVGVLKESYLRTDGNPGNFQASHAIKAKNPGILAILRVTGLENNFQVLE